MPDYEYDIFVSYKRMGEQWIRWTRENFVNPLHTLLQPSLGDVRIFLDEQIETGVSWPSALATAHSRSRLVIPILSRYYFASDWCRLELALIQHRETTLGFRTPKNSNVLVLPFTIDDGDCFPPDVQQMQSEKIHKFAQPYMQPYSQRQEDFAEHLRNWCPRIETALKNVPPYDPSWENISHTQFNDKFRIKVASQKTLPGLQLVQIPPIHP